MYTKEKCQRQADEATFGILNDTNALLALEPEYVNPEFIREAMQKLEVVCERAERAHSVRMCQVMEEVRYVHF